MTSSDFLGSRFTMVTIWRIESGEQGQRNQAGGYYLERGGDGLDQSIDYK